MATSFTLFTPNHNNQTEKISFDIDQAKPAMAFVKSNKGRKQTGKDPNQKQQQPKRRGMGVEKLERLRLQERWKKMTEIITADTKTTEAGAAAAATQFPIADPNGTSDVPLLHGLANYGVPMMVNGGSTGGLLGWPWGDPASGLVTQRVVGNGGFGGFNGSQFWVGGSANVVQFSAAAANAVGVVEASKEPTVQHCKPSDGCDLCFKKKMRCNGEKMRFKGGLKQFGQVLPRKEADFPHHCNLQEYNQNCNINEETVKGSSSRASRSSTASAYASHMKNITEAVDVVAFHVNGILPIEYDFFPVKSNRSTSSKEWKLPSTAGADAEASHSNTVDLSLKL